MRHIFSFFKMVLAVWIGLAVFCGSFALLLFSIQSFVLTSTTSAEANYESAILKISLKNNLQEEPQRNTPLEKIVHNALDIDQPLYLMDVLAAIEYAATDDNILGISLHLGGIEAGLPQLAELHNALKMFKKSNKFVYAYADFLSESDYYIASVADTLMAYPSAWVEFNGFLSSFVFVKGALDALKIKPQVFRVGDFKGAVESYTQKQLSENNRMQNQILIDELYTDYLSNIATDHVLSVEEFREIATQLKVQDAETAYKAQLISHLGYASDYDTLLQKRITWTKKQLPYVAIETYAQSIPKTSAQNKIAVIVAEGVIGQEEEISSKSFIKALKKARENKYVKAIVLRINSPGGAFYDADKMWHEIVRTKEHKPIIASMSNVAASGGYYLAMACDTIIAYPSTITGSIGVFAISLELNEFAEDFGLTFDKVQSAPYAHLGHSFFEMTAEEREITQVQVDKIYDTFLTKVAQSRGLSNLQVHKVAQGRIWTGKQALVRGLVDKNGNFTDALTLAAAAARITDYTLIYYSLQESMYTVMIQEFIATHLPFTDFLKPLNEVIQPISISTGGREDLQARMLHTFSIY